jgi:hypothetical protein
MKAGASAQVRVTSVVDDAVAVVIEQVAQLRARWSRRADRRATDRVAAAPPDAARPANALVDQGVAVVVAVVADLGRAWIHRRVGVVAVAGAISKTSAGGAIRFHRATGHAVAVAILVLAVHLIDDVLVDLAVTVVVLVVAQLGSARANRGVEVIAVAGERRVTLRRRARLSWREPGIQCPVAVAVLIQVVELSAATHGDGQGR